MVPSCEVQDVGNLQCQTHVMQRAGHKRIEIQTGSAQRLVWAALEETLPILQLLPMGALLLEASGSRVVLLRMECNRRRQC